MTFSDASNKTDRLQQLQLLFWRNPGRQFRTREIAERLGVNEDTIGRYLNELSADGRLPITKDGWYWRLVEDAHFELLPVRLNLAEGAALYDEEPTRVHLKFSHWVTKRVKETLWHPSQEIEETPDGCEWSALIGDIVEIAHWIRGWGADCEVLAPQQLREDLVKEARRLAHLYRVTPPTSPQPVDEPDMDFFNKLYGG